MRHVPASEQGWRGYNIPHPLAEGPALYYSNYKGSIILKTYLPHSWTSPVANCFNLAAWERW